MTVSVDAASPLHEERRTPRHGFERDLLLRRAAVRKTGAAGVFGHWERVGLVSLSLTHGGSPVSQTRDSAGEDVSGSRASIRCQNQPEKGVQEDQRYVQHHQTASRLDQDEVLKDTDKCQHVRGRQART